MPKATKEDQACQTKLVLSRPMFYGFPPQSQRGRGLADRRVPPPPSTICKAK